MITDQEAVCYAQAIYDPVDQTAFDFNLMICGVSVGIKELDDVTIFSFAGSEKPLDFLRDGYLIPGYHQGVGIVAEGFMVGMHSVFEYLIRYIKYAKSISITGHSLGASHAQIFAKMVINAGAKVDSLYLFAPPKTGYSELRDALIEAISTVKAYRNGKDLIPDFPLGEHWAQFDLIDLNEEPDEMQVDPIRWHMINLYRRGIEKQQAIYD